MSPSGFGGGCGEGDCGACTVVLAELDRRGEGLSLRAVNSCIQFLPNSDDFAVDTANPGYRWLELHANGRIESGIERIATLPGSVDLASNGY